jgi:hypothetical protein
MQLDSVYQIKAHTREFYERKYKMSHALIESLDAMNNERPTMLQFKKRHFKITDDV